MKMILTFHGFPLARLEIKILKFLGITKVYSLYSNDITMFLVGRSTMKCRNYGIKMSPRVTRVGSIRKDEIETVL